MYHISIVTVLQFVFLLTFQQVLKNMRYFTDESDVRVSTVFSGPKSRLNETLRVDKSFNCIVEQQEEDLKMFCKVGLNMRVKLVY